MAVSIPSSDMVSDAASYSASLEGMVLLSPYVLLVVDAGPCGGGEDDDGDEEEAAPIGGAE